MMPISGACVTACAKAGTAVTVAATATRAASRGRRKKCVMSVLPAPRHQGAGDIQLPHFAVQIGALDAQRFGRVFHSALMTKQGGADPLTFKALARVTKRA